MDGLAPSHDLEQAGASFLVWVRVRWQERTPTWTLAQVRLLLISVIPKLVLNAKQALIRVC